MEQPKFRGYSKEHEQWFYGHGWFKIDWTEEYKQEKGIGDQAMLYTDGSPVDCELESMGQFTGMINEYNEEVYQGDALLIENDILGYVYWSDDILQYIVDLGNGQTEELYDCFEARIVDNIYENPEIAK